MRAFLLASVVPALALALTACGQSSDTTDTAATTPAAPAAAPASPPPPPPPPAPPAAAAPAAAPTQQASADDATAAAVKLRQGSMLILSFSNGPVGAMMRGQAPFDTAAVKTAADRLAVVAPMIPGVFATDTSAASGIETEARAAIWANKADFDSKANDLLVAAQALSAAAATGDEAATRAAVGGIGAACSACHDDYREQ